MKSTVILFVFCLAATSLHAEMAAINGHNVNLRKGPGKSYAAEWKYGKGFPVKIIKRQGEWVNIEDFEGEKGWVFSSLLTENQHVIVKINHSEEKTILIREDPSDISRVVGQAHHGVVFRKEKESEEWVKIAHETGLQGWIKKKFLWGY